ncbi:MAG TPA: methylmalonyl-CoA mutase family protein [Mangrovimonas sp.]|nr:methylmalonyl-CoA mutase family protein [Mangrovimonas sp.]
MNSNHKLFQDFTPVTKQQWIDKVTLDLKGEDFNKLVWKNLNGLTFQPFYTIDDKVDFLAGTGENSQALINFRTIPVTNVEKANNEALLAIKEGMTGLVFDFKETVSLEQLFKGIDLNTIAVSLVVESETQAVVDGFFEYAEKNLTSKKNLKGYLDLGILTKYVTKGSLNSAALDAVVKFINKSSSYPNFRVLTISGTPFLDSGSNQVQEVAYTLNALVFVADGCLNRGVSEEVIFNNLAIQLGIASEFFIEIGKFRAFHSLLKLIAKKYRVTEFNPLMTAKTSVWSKSVTDAHTNMLRATTETMSAILGNVDGVLIDPYDKEFKAPTDFSSRIAGNISTILREESYLGKVANPVDGAYYIEEITTKIAEKSLELFKEIEQYGGFYQAFENEVIQKQISEIRQEKIKLISQRRLPMVGVNKYPNLMETIASQLLSSGELNNPKLLTPRRASLEIEAVRKTTEKLVEETGKRPIVELTSYGNLTMRKARAAFSYDLLGVSGFEIWQEKSFENALKAAEGSANSESDVVVICSSDPDYEESALAFVKAFRAQDTNKILLLAGNPVGITDQLNQAGLDGYIHIKSDVIQTISNIQEKVQHKLKSLEV